MDDFTKAYIVCLLWSNELDEYTADDIEKESLEGIIEDCKQFQEDNAEHLSELDLTQCGHDFCLTRNHHGAGFWDRGLGELGQTLTRAAEEYNEFTAFFENGKVYVE